MPPTSLTYRPNPDRYLTLGGRAVGGSIIFTPPPFPKHIIHADGTATFAARQTTRHA